jgi:hypothetical protein
LGCNDFRVRWPLPRRETDAVALGATDPLQQIAAQYLILTAHSQGYRPPSYAPQMANRSAAGFVLGVAIVTIAATGCATEGKPTHAESAGNRSLATATSSETPSVTTPQTSSATVTSEPLAPTPIGQPVGTATMEVVGGVGVATIRYQINGGPEQTETNVTLPWAKQYCVYNEVQSSVTADAGESELTCSITMDGKLLAFKSQSRPTCSFAYWG